MNNLRLRTKLGLLVGVMAATIVMVAAVGLYQLVAVNARLQHMVDVTSKEADLCSQMRYALLNMRRYELDAILEVEDKPSEVYVGKARQVSQEIDQDRQKLAALIEQSPSAEDRQAIQDFNHSWDDYQPLQQQVLDLALQNSNYKAHLQLRGPLADKLAEYEAAIDEALQKADKDVAEASQMKETAGLAAAVARRRALFELDRLVLELHRDFG
ncbi:MAG TPA: MCP four helix bundle domain-containing protein, partial [Gemmataceae bacterium]|nr:MCP four helix bundle domain-containing protein [Gemmataceae bacterium]